MSDTVNIAKNSTTQKAWKETEEFQSKFQGAKEGDADAMYALGTICQENRAYQEAGNWFLRSAKKGHAMAYFRLGCLCEENKLNNISYRENKIVKYYGISAVLGCSYGQKKLADCYYEGNYGLKKDTNLAKDWYLYSAKQNNADAALMLGNLTNKYEWYKQAAEAGSTEAQFKCALLCTNAQEKEKWLLLSSENGYLQATMMLAELYENRDTVDSNKAAYKLYFKAVSKHSNAEAAVRMAEMLTTGVKGIDRNLKYAKKLIDFAAQYNHPEALYKLGCMYWTGNDVLKIKKDPVKAIELLKTAAKQNHAGAAFNVGVISVNKCDYQSAKQYLLIAAENGHDTAKYELAKVYWNLSAYEEAIKWYVEAVKSGNEAAQKALGDIYRTGDNVTKNYEYALKYYSMVPICKDNAIQLLVGQLYQSGGFGIKKDYVAAYSWLLKAAEQGNIEASFLVGKALDSGSGVAKNKKMALQWIEKAALEDHVRGLTWAGYMYAHGEGTVDGTADYIKAVQYDKRAVALGNPTAKNNLAFLYYRGHGVEKDFSMAFSLFLEAANSGVLVSMNMVADMYRDGTGIEKNIQESFNWYKRAADKKDKDSAFIVAEMYRIGEDIPKDEVSALNYYESAAKQKHAKASDWAGYMYLNGIGCQYNIEKAREYFAVAAEAGVVRSQYYFGEILYSEDKKYLESLGWYKKAAEQDFMLAEYKLAEMYRKGEGTASSNRDALIWYEKAAAHDYLKAIEWSGYMYETGSGTPEEKADYDRAVEYYNQAIDKNSYYARERLGLLYYNGTGVDIDYSKAFQLLYIAANDGNRLASQRQIAIMFRDGCGTEVNLPQSFTWFEKAALKHDKESLFEAAEMLRTGSGIPMDMALAFKHYEESANLKFPKACDWAGYMRITGIECDRDIPTAKSYFTFAANAGIPRSQYYLGEILFSIDKSYPDAIRFYTAAANSDYVDALCKLGEEYSSGNVVNKDLKLAEGYLRRAIAQDSNRARAILGRNLWFGDNTASYPEAVGLFNYVLQNDESGQAYPRAELLLYLGDAYRIGKGVSQNPTVALEYYKQSASLGSAEAMVNLATIYREGRIVEKDKKIARVWMENAAKLGNEYAIKKTNSLRYKLFG